jgi:hypothetical protein
MRVGSARIAGRTGPRPWTLWWAGDDRFRFEQGTGGHASTRVRNGATWWTQDGSGDVRANRGDSNVVLGLPPELALLHPRSLLAAAVLEVDREQHVAGREAVVLRATPRPGDRHWRWWRAEEPMEVPIDLERGVALGASWLEVDEIAFDEELGPDLFSLPAAGAGMRIRPVMERPRRVEPGEAVSTADLPISLPELLPEGARLLRAHMDGATPPEWVGWSWAVDPGCRYMLHLRQGPAVAREAARWRGEAVVRDGAKLHVDSTGTSHDILVERAGHWSELHSDLPLDLLVAVALSIPAPS